MRTQPQALHDWPVGRARPPFAFVVGMVALALLMAESPRALADPFVYVTHGPGPVNPEFVFALDVATGAVNPIPLGNETLWSSAVSASGKLQLVRTTNPRGGYSSTWEVSIVDTQTQRVTGEFQVTEPAGGVAIAPHGPLAYLTDCTSLSAGDGVLDVVDLTSGEVVDQIPLGVDPQDLRLSPEGDRAYVMGDGYCRGRDDHAVEVVDTTRRQTITTIPVPSRTQRLVVSPSGDRIYVGSGIWSQPGYWLSVIDARTDAVLEHRALPFAPTDIGVSPDGRMLYLLRARTGEAGQVVLADAETGAVVGEISLPENGQPAAVAVQPVGRLLYVLYSVDYVPALAEIDLATRTVVRTLAVPGGARLDFVGSCDGDCNADGTVSVDELVRAVSVALDGASILACAAADRGSDGMLAVDDLVAAVGSALNGCAPPPPTRTPTCTPTPTHTPLEPGGCSDVCDGRGCQAQCASGDTALGYCSGGVIAGQCACQPFECPGTCNVRIDPITSPWTGSAQTLTGSADYYSYWGQQSDVTVYVSCGAEEVSVTAQDGRFAVAVALRSGLNELSIFARNDGFGPPSYCRARTRRDVNGQLLDICACQTGPCTCAPTATVTATPTATSTATRTACLGECPTSTPTPTAAATCQPAVPERPSATP